MILLGFSPYIIFTSLFTTLLLDRGIHVTGNKQFPTSSPWNPPPSLSRPAKTSNDESEALKKVLPLVTFDCRGKTGYFPDSKFNCEVFHYCQPDGARNTFHCPTHQLFNQLSMVCEVKTIHNSRLCKEGSINSAKLQKNSASKKHEASLKTGPIFKPTLKDGNLGGDVPKKIVTLEDLLSYMNSGQLGRESEPTFISRFHKADESKRTKVPSDSAITTPVSENKSNSHKNPSKPTDDALAAQGSDQSFSVAKSQSKFGVNLKKNAEEEEDISIEYDAIEGGRKFRKHKRVGRVLDVPTEQPKKEKENKSHDHLTVRSAADTQGDESTTPSTVADSKNNSNAPSLFSTDRNKARDFRKRKRYQGRKRKITTPGNETDAEVGMATTTAMPYAHSATRQDSDIVRGKNAYRRRKSQRPRIRDESLRGVQKSERIEPYTLPPLPMSDGEKVETTTQSMVSEEKRKEGHSKNPWHKPTPASTTEGAQFGVKLSDLDQHHYQTDIKMAEGPAPPADYYGIKDIPINSEEMMGEEYRERIVMHSKNLNDPQSSHQSNTKSKKYNDEENYKYRSHSDKHHHTALENVFPPPRAEAREHHTTPPQQMIISHESGFEKSKNKNSLKATTDDPFRVTHPYIAKYQSASQKLKDAEEQLWKAEAEAEKDKSDDKKIEVGATFFFKDPVTTTKKPRLQVPPTTEAPVTHSTTKERDISKHTLAQQHLSKIMNDFFAMSSSSAPGHTHLDSNKEEDLIVPEYRIPDEDIYTGSESATDDAEEIPPELLEVVDLLTGHAGNGKSDLKPRASHEIIKIDGPITESHIEKIFMDEKFDDDDDDSNRHESADGSYKKIVVVPQPQEDKEIGDIAEVAELASLKLEPLLKQISDEKSLRVIPLNPEPVVKRQPTLLKAKKIPVRVIYRDQLSAAIRSQLPTRKPNVKIVRTRLASPNIKLISGGKWMIPSPYSHSYTRTRTSIVLHPPTLFPPHPPPLPRKHLPFKIGYPFVTNSRSRMQNTQLHRRRKRSLITRLRRQIRQNQNFLPFSTPVYPTFNPKFVPTFSPFKALFSPSSLHTSGTHVNPFVFPGFPLAKPSQNRPSVFQPSHPRPPPVRHVTHSGHQAVIVEEVPVPIHVEVPNPNLIRPLPSGAHPPKLNPQRYPGNQFRAPSPPAIQTPPLIQRPQNRFPPPPRPPHSNSNNYRPLGMPSNARPPQPMNYRSPLPLTGPLPPSITSDGQVYALGVTNKPIIPENSRPVGPPNGGPKPPRNPPRPYNPFSVHASAYPNFPYFQGAFTTPISNEPVIGRIMYSGYKPPRSTTGTKPPKPSTRPKERNTSESKPNRSRSKSEYFEAPAKPMRESHVSYTEEVIQRGRSRPKQNLDDYSVNHKDLKPPKQSLSKNSGSSDDYVPRKRRPGRRRRPRPHSTTQGTPVLNDISPTPPPPEQIPPPPADYTSKPSQHETLSSLPSFNAGTKVPETSSHFPPAGYYGKDQLVQFFDSSSKSYQKTTSPKPYQHRDLGESRSSAEYDESVTSSSGEDGGEPAFGTRLKSKPRSQSRNRQLKNNQPAQSQTQKAEIRTRPNNRPEESPEQKKREFRKPNENNKTPVRNDRPPPRRRRPPPPRPRNGPPPGQAPQPEVHHFKYNENVGNFYSVPRGLQNLVAPSAHPPQGFRGSTDMFGIPHPVIDQNIYSLRPQGAPDFDPNFFSVPAHVAQQQQSPLHSMNIKPIPESARNFFTAPEPSPSTVPEASAPEKKEAEQSVPSNKPEGDSNEQREPPVRKLRKPKRKNRYNPHSSEQRDTSTESISVKPHTEQMTTRDSSTVRYREKATTVATTTAEPRSTVSNYHSQNDIRETPAVFKQRTPLLPKTLPELSKSLLNGKIDIQKLNATISTSVSVSGAVPQTNNTSSEEKENKRVFSSQNGGGLAVVRKGPKRKRARQRVSTTTGVPYVNNIESSTDAKYEIAASVLDIIKATTETERQASGYYNNYYDSNKNEKPSSSRVSNTWVENSSSKRQK